MSFIAILGRQHNLSLAELESVCGVDALSPINADACLLASAPNIASLGGTIKIASLEAELQTDSLQEITSKGFELIQDLAAETEGKIQFGVSIYGKKIKPYDVQKLGLSIKKQLRANGVSVRLIPNKAQELNTAQVLHNRLTKNTGYELVVVIENGKTYLGRTIAVQNIDAYTIRDREKPARDAFVGMLPPKLAQIMLNCAKVSPKSTVLDPFCGTGTVLLEATLMGATIIGSDLSEEMVQATRQNVQWLFDTQLHIESPNVHNIITRADAQSVTIPKDVNAIVCETYLGPPMREDPTDTELQKIITDVRELHINFLKNVATQTSSGTRLCLVVPQWRLKNKTISLNLLDDLEKLGYNRVSFKHSSTELEYFRPAAHVARQLLILTRK